MLQYSDLATLPAGLAEEALGALEAQTAEVKRLKKELAEVQNAPVKAISSRELAELRTALSRANAYTAEEKDAAADQVPPQSNLRTMTEAGVCRPASPSCRHSVRPVPPLDGRRLVP